MRTASKSSKRRAASTPPFHTYDDGKDGEQNCVAFHHKAREIFFDLYSKFRNTIASIDRQRDENVFQQVQGRYTGQLKQQLQGIAMDILAGAASGTDRHELHRTLISLVADYVHEFMQKVRSLQAEPCTARKFAGKWG